MPLARRRGRAPLLGTMARTAVVAGTATAVSGNVARRQAARAAASAPPPAAEPQADWAAQQQWASQQVGPAPATAPPPVGSVVDQIRDLAALHAQGALTDEEFSALKAKVLG